MHVKRAPMLQVFTHLPEQTQRLLECCIDLNAVAPNWALTMVAQFILFAPLSLRFAARIKALASMIQVFTPCAVLLWRDSHYASADCHHYFV